MKGQHDIAKRWRLNRGCCPVHGTPLQVITTVYTFKGVPVFFAVCPRKKCDHIGHYKQGSKPYEALKEIYADQVGKSRSSG